MRALAKTLEQHFLNKQIGATTPVLFESQVGQDTWKGHTENYCQVEAKGHSLSNTLKIVQITGIQDNILVGELAETPSFQRRPT